MIQELHRAYLQRYPKRRVHLILTGSHTARLQLERGAPPGIFISASPQHIDALDRLGQVAHRQTIAYNELVLLTRSALKIHNLSEIHRAKRWGLGDPRVPIGELAWSLLDEIKVNQRPLLTLITPRIVTRSLSARALRGRAQRNELDATVLYRTDLFMLRQWYTLPLPHSLVSKYRAHYELAITRDHSRGPVSTRAYDWLKMMNSPLGKRIITKLGFQTH